MASRPAGAARSSTLGGHFSAAGYRRSCRISKPFALHAVMATATQSGAPLGATAHFSCTVIDAGVGNAHHGVGRILGGIDCGLGGNAGLVGRNSAPASRRSEVGIEVRSLVAEPMAEACRRSSRCSTLRRRIRRAGVAAPQPPWRQAGARRRKNTRAAARRASQKVPESDRHPWSIKLTSGQSPTSQ